MNTNIVSIILFIDLRCLSLSSWLCAFSLSGCLTCEPNSFTNVIISQFIEDSVRSQSDEIMLLRYLKGPYVRYGLNNIWIATSELKLCLWISKCATDRETPWQDSYGPHYKFRVSYFAVFLLLRQLFLLVQDLRRSCLVDLTTCLDYAFVFFNVWRLMISTESCHLQAPLRG